MLEVVLGSMNHEGLEYIPLVFWLAAGRNRVATSAGLMEAAYMRIRTLTTLQMGFG